MTFWKDDMPIVIGEKKYRGRGLAQKVIKALISRGKALGYECLFVREIYSFNVASQHCFERVGFRMFEQTETGFRYQLLL